MELLYVKENENGKITFPGVTYHNKGKTGLKG